MRRRGRAGLAPLPAVEQRRELAAREHRPDERAHHVAQERVGGDLEREHVVVDLDPARRLDRAHERPVQRVGRRERAKVVLRRRAAPRAAFSASTSSGRGCQSERRSSNGERSRRRQTR